MISKKDEIRKDYTSLGECRNLREPQRLCDILQMMFGEEMTNEWTKGNGLPEAASVDLSAIGKSADGERKVTEWQTNGIKEEILINNTEKRTPDTER